MKKMKPAYHRFIKPFNQRDISFEDISKMVYGLLQSITFFYPKRSVPLIREAIKERIILYKKLTTKELK